MIHETAIVSKMAKIGKNVQIGPYCLVGDHVSLADGVVLKSHVVIEGNTEIGEGTKIFPFASIGSDPQDLKFAGENSRIIIGKNNLIREYVTINPGTKSGIMETRIGNDCLLMISSHIAHDCVIGDHVILANNVTLAGHVTIEEHAIIGGMSAIHQFVRVGAHAMIGGMSAIEKDIIPFGMAFGERANLAGLNIVGMKRRNFTKDDMNALRSAYDMIFVENNDLTFAERLHHVGEAFAENVIVSQLVNFLKTDSSRAICTPKKN